MAVPKNMQEKYDAVAAYLIPYCDEVLNEEYKSLCLYTLEKLCRKRPSPLERGRPKTWAAGIVYAIGSNNFIFDRSSPVHMTGDELAAPFGISKSTMSNKGAEIKKLLKIEQFKSEWILPSMIESSPFAWMVSVGPYGLPVDARTLPLEMQINAAKRGLIPYVPALRNQEEQEKTAQHDEKGQGQENQK